MNTLSQKIKENERKFEEKKIGIHSYHCDVMTESGMQLCNCDERDKAKSHISSSTLDILDTIEKRIEELKKRNNGETQKCYRCGLPRKASEKLMLGCSTDKGFPYRTHLFRKAKNVTKTEALTLLQNFIKQTKEEIK